VMMLRYKYPQEYRPFKCPAVYVVATLSFLLCSFLFAQLLIENWKPYLASTLMGLVVYLVFAQFKKRQSS
jgi:basic amino acid/polyamine antiporter, APA family